MKPYYLGCSAIGLTAGLLVGLSNSPVVQYVLPLIFAVIGGGASIFALKASATSRDAKYKINIVGYSAIYLAIPFLISIIYGSLIRTGAGISSLLPRVVSSERAAVLSPEILAELPIDDLISLLTVDRSMATAGISSIDRKPVVAKLAAARLEHRREIALTTNQIAEFAKKISARLRDSARVNADLYDDSSFVKFKGQIDLLGMRFSAKYLSYTEKISTSKEIYEDLISNDFYLYGKYLGNKPGIAGSLEASDSFTYLIMLLTSLPPPEIVDEDLVKQLQVIGQAPNTPDLPDLVVPSVAVMPRTADDGRT